MTEHDIEVMRQRIAAAKSDRDRWHRDGPQERFLESYVVVKALELELDEMLSQQRRAVPR